jgi:hypothetical protein
MRLPGLVVALENAMNLRRMHHASDEESLD